MIMEIVLIYATDKNHMPNVKKYYFQYAMIMYTTGFVNKGLLQHNLWHN